MVLLVFLGHAGCTFRREALTAIARERRAVEERGARIILVHMGDDAPAIQEQVEKYDREQQIYCAMGRGHAIVRPSATDRPDYAGNCECPQ